MPELELTPITALGVLFLCGYLVGKGAKWLKFPRVTGYIVAGVLLSPSLSGLLSAELVTERFAIVTDLALAIIAFAIGGSLKLSKLRQLGKSILWINFSQALCACLFTFGLLAALGPWLLGAGFSRAFFISGYLPMALMVGAVSAATAPAAVLAIVHEYRARGPLTTTLLGVVALDDATAIILFAFASNLGAAAIELDAFSCYRGLVLPSLMILAAVLWGALGGFLLTTLTGVVKRKESLLVVILGGLLLVSGIAEQLQLSPLLATMTVGFCAVNRFKDGDNLFQAIERIEEPIFALFFTLAGAHFDFQVIKLAGPLALLIVLARFSGKLLGTKLGAGLAGAPQVVRKYLGYGLLPKAGVTVGLILMAQPPGNSQLYEIMLNAVLGSVIINELIAPPLVKYALLRAGEGIEE